MNYEEAKLELSITRAREKCLRDAVAYFEATDKAERKRLKASYDAKRVRVNERIRAASGWVEWGRASGPPPICQYTCIQVMYSDGEVQDGRVWHWTWEDDSEVVRYRVIK